MGREEDPFMRESSNSSLGLPFGTKLGPGERFNIETDQAMKKISGSSGCAIMIMAAISGAAGLFAIAKMFA